jgi:hypothetical protein
MGDAATARRIRPWHVPMTGRDPSEPHRASTPLELLFDLDTTHQATDLGAQAAAATVAVPVAVYLAALAVLHAVRGLGLVRQVVVSIALALVAALAATWIGVAAAVVVTAILVSALVAINIVTIERQSG